MKVCRVTEKVEWLAVQPFDVYACIYIYMYIHVRIIILVYITRKIEKHIRY